MFLPEWIGHRHYIAMQCFLGLVLSYIMRFALSLALTEMSDSAITKEDLNSCPIPESYNTTVSHDKEFHWLEHEKGLVNSAFFWGYSTMQLPGGIIADKWNPNKVITLGSIGTSLFTILTPYSARAGQWQGLIAVRVIVGIFQGVFYAALHTLVGSWIPKEERGRWGTIIFSGVHVGNALNMFLTGLFLNRFKGGWPYVFYVYGSIGMIWSLLFYFTTYSSPQKHPNLSAAEKRLFQLSLDKNTGAKKRKVPWREILKCGPVWAASIAMIGHDFGLFAMVTEIPKFMKTVLHFNVKENGSLNALTYLLIWIFSVLSGYLVDFLNNRKIISLTVNRKIGTTIASVGPSLGFIASVYVGCNSGIAVACLIMGQALMGFYYSSLKLNSIDLTKNYTGTVSALVTAIGTSTGIYVPYLIGALTPNNTLGEWRTVMWLSFIVMTVTNIIYLFTASGEVQVWDLDEKPIISHNTVKDHVQIESNINVISFKNLNV